MYKDEINLYKEIRAFKLWAEKNHPNWGEENDNGEWEIGVDNHFDEMVNAALKIMENDNENHYCFFTDFTREEYTGKPYYRKKGVS